MGRQLNRRRSTLNTTDKHPEYTNHLLGKRDSDFFEEYDSDENDLFEEEEEEGRLTWF